MAVRSALPWPVRWMAGAVVLGFSAAIGLWAFEFGKGIAGLDSGAKDELKLLRAEVVQLRQDRDKLGFAQNIVIRSRIAKIALVVGDALPIDANESGI